MGYTHYWKRPTTIQPSTFNAIGNDLMRLLPALETARVPLANAHGREEPEIGPEFIGFNGVACCGHAQNPAIRLPWPTAGAHGVGDNRGMGAALPHRTCNGDCSYESVWFERIAEDDGGFCKTAFRPYDLAVTVFLVIAKHHLGKLFTVETDGKPIHWADALALCQTELGYGEAFSFTQGQLLSGGVASCA